MFHNLIYFSIDSTTLLRFLVIVAITLLAVWKDIKSYKIPNYLVLGGLMVSILLLIYTFATGGGLITYVVAGVLTFMVLVPVYLMHGIGAGDVKLLTVIGLLSGVDAMIRIIALSFLCAGLTGIVLIVSGAGGRRQVMLPNGTSARFHTIHFSISIFVAEMLTYGILVAGGC